MQGSHRRRFEAMGRVRDFLRAHPFADPGHAVLAARFDAVLTRAMGVAVEEQAGRLQVRAATRHRQALRRELHTTLLRFVARLGEVAARARPDLAGRFRAPAPGVSNAAFLARGWDLLNLAREHEQLLASHGLGAAQLDHLASRLTGLEAVAERSNAGRRAHVGCRAELRRLASELSALALVLDPLVQTVHQGDAQLLAAWASARNVTGPLRPKELSRGPLAAAAPEGGELGRAA